MNDAAVTKLWEAFQSLERRLLVVENKVEFLKGQVKARLEAEARGRMMYHPRSGGPPI